jgi:hypothetical protein
MTIPAGGMASVSSSGVYEIHFNVTPDAENHGKLLISANVVIPRESATSRYSRSLTVSEGEVAKFELEAMGAFPSPGEVAITAKQVIPQS